MTNIYRLWHWWISLTGRDRATIILEVLGILVVSAYTFQAYRANQLTREAITLNQRPILIPTISNEYFPTEDWKHLQTSVGISDEGKSPTLYWGSARFEYSEQRIKSLWDEMPFPERRMVFPTNGDVLSAITATPLTKDLSIKIARGEQQKGWFYVGIWLWYDRYRVFICREYQLPAQRLFDSKQCSDPDSNYAD